MQGKGLALPLGEAGPLKSDTRPADRWWARRSAKRLCRNVPHGTRYGTSTKRGLLGRSLRDVALYRRDQPVPDRRAVHPSVGGVTAHPGPVHPLRHGLELHADLKSEHGIVPIAARSCQELFFKPLVARHPLVS